MEFNKNNVKIGDKVTLFKYSECEQQQWYSINPYGGEDPHGADPHGAPEFLVYYTEEYQEVIIEEMFQYLGCIDLTVSEVFDDCFYIKEGTEEWSWPYQLIKNIKK